MTSIKWGILGSGRMAEAFTMAMSGVADSEILAIASRDQARADEFAKKHDIRIGLGEYEQILSQEIDVVYIATPHAFHEKNMCMCLEAGKAVLCEKPFTINALEAERVITLARSNELFLMEAMWTRFIPSIIKLRELLANKVIGNVQVMLAGGAFMPEFDPDFYLFDPELGGGVLLDAGVYLISMASMLFGKPRSIRALASLGKSGVDEHDAYLLEHENGALANLYVSLRGQSSPDLTLLGSEGKIYLQAPIFCPAKITLENYQGESQSFDLPFPANGYQFEIEEVNKCLRQGVMESNIMPLDETLEIMRTMDEIRKQIGLKYPME